MESASRSSSLPMPAVHSATSRKRRILDSSDTEEQPSVKRSRSLVPRALGDNSVPQPSSNLQKPASNIDNKTVRDKKKRRKRKRKVSVVQDNLEGENAERRASQVASGSGSRRSPSLAPMREPGTAPVTTPSPHPPGDATGTSHEALVAPDIPGEIVIKRETQSPAVCQSISSSSQVVILYVEPPTRTRSKCP
ncbi:hypothetical protein NLI96_g12930 [Meripilus lineatus]|uniref:Uncharacterized protein n=1 Tax=Meripilus lineatus TaxID=2056292 RepID=A0AAD5URE5_9APHY|nr:hypothetical protein NLI96_g12930 [Physisporinus lineatus]